MNFCKWYFATGKKDAAQLVVAEELDEDEEEVDSDDNLSDAN